jgi:hypothetical protein
LQAELNLRRAPHDTGRSVPLNSTLSQMLNFRPANCGTKPQFQPMNLKFFEGNGYGLSAKSGSSHYSPEIRLMPHATNAGAVF